jgi:hypothetical protein
MVMILHNAEAGQGELNASSRWIESALNFASDVFKQVTEEQRAVMRPNVDLTGRGTES